MKRKSIMLSLLLLLIVAVAVIYRVSNRPSHSQVISTAKTPQTSNGKTQPSPSDIASSLEVVVNKGRQLPATYIPAGLVVPNITLSESRTSENMHLRPEVARALEQMAAAASSEGVRLMIVSGYRSFATQTTVYNGYVSTIGQAAADASSARPGFSEHQTGLAADIGDTSRTCQLDQCFDATPAGKWLAANAPKYGFIIRYPKGKQALTGYEYEPWHVRYVGTEVSMKMAATGQTLEQYYGLPTYLDYTAKAFELRSD